MLARFLMLGGALKTLKQMKTLAEQQQWYAKFRSKTDFVANLLHSTRRVWAPFLGVPDSQLQLYQGTIRCMTVCLKL